MEQSHEQEAPERHKPEVASARLPRELREPGEVAGPPVDRFDEARRRLRDVGRQASDSWQRAGNAARSYTRDNPAAVALLAFGAGLAAGLLLAPRRPPGRSGRSLPALASVADAVLSVFDRRR